MDVMLIGTWQRKQSRRMHKKHIRHDMLDTISEPRQQPSPGAYHCVSASVHDSMARVSKCSCPAACTRNQSPRSHCFGCPCTVEPSKQERGSYSEGNCSGSPRRRSECHASRQLRRRSPDERYDQLTEWMTIQQSLLNIFTRRCLGLVTE